MLITGKVESREEETSFLVESMSEFGVKKPKLENDLHHTPIANFSEKIMELKKAFQNSHN